MSEQSDFLADVEVKPLEILEQPLDIEGTKSAEESEEDTEQKAKNRRERRLLERNQQLREEAIALNARLQGISEAQVTRTEEPAEYLKRASKIYGDATPEAKEATELLREALNGVKETAKQEAIEELERRNATESNAVKEEEKNLDEMLEMLEDDHGADFSNEDTRKGFLDLLEKLSPKDRDGNIKEYADPETTWEVYESRGRGSASRAKDLASRSMTRGGGSQDSKLQDDAITRYLKENGIID
jgi:hypothetical protein